jgi:competence protein ComEA
MIRTLVAAAAALFAAGAFAATDVNTASQADLEALRGIGPVQAKLILNEREKGPFKNWTDFKKRVKGVGPTASTRYSEAGMTINGAGYTATSTRSTRANASAGQKPGYVAETKAAAKEGAAGVGPGFRQMGEGVKQMGRNVKDSAKEQASEAKAGARDVGARMSSSAPAR